jgi:hypothetical protein
MRGAACPGSELLGSSFARRRWRRGDGRRNGPGSGRGNRDAGTAAGLSARRRVFRGGSGTSGGGSRSAADRPRENDAQKHGFAHRYSLAKIRSNHRASNQRRRGPEFDRQSLVARLPGMTRNGSPDDGAGPRSRNTRFRFCRSVPRMNTTSSRLELRLEINLVCSRPLLDQWSKDAAKTIKHGQARTRRGAGGTRPYRSDAWVRAGFSTRSGSGPSSPSHPPPGSRTLS